MWVWCVCGRKAWHRRKYERYWWRAQVWVWCVCGRKAGTGESMSVSGRAVEGAEVARARGYRIDWHTRGAPHATAHGGDTRT